MSWHSRSGWRGGSESIVCGRNSIWYSTSVCGWGGKFTTPCFRASVGVALEFDDISEQLDPAAGSLNKQVRRIRQQVEHYIREARQSIWNLRSPSLTSINLSTALRQFGDAAIRGQHARLEFGVVGTEHPAPLPVAEQLLRIGQEAMTNALRHSGADTIVVELHYGVDTVALVVRDNGCGFDVEQVGQPGDEHWGVTSMRERAQQIGAEFVVNSTL